MRYLVKCGWGIGDVLMCFPGLKHLHDQGHEVLAYCRPQHRGLFDLISYASVADGPETPHDRHISMRVYPERFDDWRRSGLNIQAFRCRLNPETEPAEGKPIVLDRTFKMEELRSYDLPEQYDLISPFSHSLHSSEKPPIAWYLDQLRELTGDVCNVHILASGEQRVRFEGSYSSIPRLTALQLSHLPTLIRKARTFITLNNAPGHIASAVRESYHVVLIRKRAEIQNWKAENQIYLTWEGFSKGMLNPGLISESTDTRHADVLLAGLPNVWPGDKGSDWWNSRNCYPFYAGLGQLLKPSKILEFGVRLGYSLIAMLRAHSGVATIIGVDSEAYIPGSNRMAEENIRAAGYKGELSLLRKNSHHATLPRDEFDLVHVDGDHSLNGAKLDIQSGWDSLKPGGVMVVDDTTFLSPVRKAVEHCKMVLPKIAYEFYYPSFRGCWIAAKGR